MRSLTKMLVLSSALLSPAAMVTAPASAQTQPTFPATEVEIEGRIQKMVNENGTRTMTVMGTLIQIPPDESVTISTPTNPDITWADAVRDGIPGKPEGFKNATAIVIGESNGATVIARDIALNPEENVALGYITQNSNNTLKLDGMEIVLMPPRDGTASFPAGKSPFDARVPGNALKNDFGFPLVRNSIVPGTPVAAEGWWSDDGKMYLWDLEVSGGEIALPTMAKISILRAQCRQRAPNDIEIELRGATYRGQNLPPATRVEVFRVAGNNLPRFTYSAINVSSVADAEDGRFALYRVDARLTNAQTGSATGDGCPSTIGVRMIDPTTGRPATATNPNTGAIVNVQDTLQVDNRID